MVAILIKNKKTRHHKEDCDHGRSPIKTQ